MMQNDLKNFAPEWVAEKGHVLTTASGSCIKCGAAAIDLYEDAAYGPVRDCTAPTSDSTEQSVQVIDLDAEAFNALVKAANESNWIPPEYHMNDWVSDCCDFLCTGKGFVTDSTDLEARLRRKVPESDWPHGIFEVLRNPDGPEAADTLASQRAEITRLRDKLARAREALEDVVSPLNAFQRKADEEGAILSAAAYSIANDLGFVRGIASQALKDTAHD